ncbi:DNA double-strand break repair protein Mre11 [Archaeoglobus sp.]
MKFAHIADVHLGYEQYKLPYRSEEFALAFKKAVEIAVKNCVDFILISGDLFHSSRPTPETLKEAVDILSIPKEENVPVFAIEGNHDRTRRKVSAYHLLEDLDLINLMGVRSEKVESRWLVSEKIDRGYLVKGVVDSVEIHGMGYMSAVWFEKNDIRKVFKPEGDAILMLHQGIKEIAEKFNSESFELKMEDLPRGYLYYAMGHIHKSFETNYDIGKLVYPGSLQRWDFGDFAVRYYWDGLKLKTFNGVKKGFYIVEDFEPKFVEIDVRPFVDVRIEGDEKTVKRLLLDIRSKIPSEAFVRLDLKWREPFDVSSIRELLRAKFVQIRTRFEKVTVSGGKKVKPEEFFDDVELKVIELAGEREFNADEIINLLVSKALDVKITDEKPDKKPEIKGSRPKPEKKGIKPKNLLDWCEL